MSKPDSPAVPPLISFHDEQIAAADLLRQAEANLSRRPATPDDDWPSYGQATIPDLPADGRHLFRLHYALRQLHDSYPQVETEPVLVATPSLRVPILGALWRQIRAQAHELVLFYVNRFVGQQTHVNHLLAQTVNELSQIVIRQDEEIKTLRRQLADKEGES